MCEGWCVSVLDGDGGEAEEKTEADTPTSRSKNEISHGSRRHMT